MPEIATISDTRPKLTTREIAARDQVAPETVRARAKLGHYPGAEKEGRDWRFPPDARWTKLVVEEEEAGTSAQAAEALAALRAWRAV